MRLRVGGRVGASTDRHRRVPRCAAGGSQGHLRPVEPAHRLRRSRVPDVCGGRRRRGHGAVRLRAGPRRRAPQGPARRHRQRAAARRGRRRAPERPRVQPLLPVAVRRGQRDDAQRDLARHARSHRAPRPVPQARRQSRPHRQHRRRDPALVDAGDALQAHDHDGGDDRRRDDPCQRAGRVLAHLREPRRHGVRQPAHVRHRARSEPAHAARGVRWRRTSLLPRSQPRPRRDQGHVPGDRQAHPRHATRRATAPTALELHKRHQRDARGVRQQLTRAPRRGRAYCFQVRSGRWRLPGWLARLADIGAEPSDSDDLRVRKAVLTLSSTLMASVASVWVVTYAVLGLWWSAVIPFVYQLASFASIFTFARTHRYRLFRRSQLWMTLLLPFALQWSLGGFENSSAVCLWAITAPLGALLFVGAREGWPWFGAFVALVAFSGAIDTALSADPPYVPGGVMVTFFVLNIVAVAATAYLLLQYFVRAREAEQARSERLLLNVLPESVAARLKKDEGVIADTYGSVTVLFADIVGFTPMAERLPAADVVAALDRVFGRWDDLAARYGVEKIKTIGDAYMVAGGIPVPRDDHAEAIAEMALGMRPELDDLAAETGLALEVRIGIDTGPVVAGVIGRAKFIYDLWGDTVNTASRMEAHAPPGSIHVTERTFERLRPRYELRPRGTIEVKGKGPMTTYLLIGRRDTEPELVTEATAVR